MASSIDEIYGKLRPGDQNTTQIIKVIKQNLPHYGWVEVWLVQIKDYLMGFPSIYFSYGKSHQFSNYRHLKIRVWILVIFGNIWWYYVDNLCLSFSLAVLFWKKSNCLHQKLVNFHTIIRKIISVFSWLQWRMRVHHNIIFLAVVSSCLWWPPALRLFWLDLILMPSPCQIWHKCKFSLSTMTFKSFSSVAG